jgi:hypothetical protein
MDFSINGRVWAVFIGLGKYDFKLCDLEILITHPNAQV